MLISSFIASFFYIISPCVDMRESPKSDSEMVSQGYFSERVKLLEESGEWQKIETTVDGYTGWIKKGALCKDSGTFLTGASSIEARVVRLRAHVYDRQDTIFGPVLILPFESKLELIDLKDKESKTRWIKVSLPDGREGFIQRGDVIIDPQPMTREEMCALSKKFMDLPYTWGGRSSFGYDCSGFVQMLYRQMGVFLPRDSKDQMRWEGFQEVEEKDLQPGDLIFFGFSADKISHVGMFLEGGFFIHSTASENQHWISSLADQDWNGSGRLPYRAFRSLKRPLPSNE